MNESFRRVFLGLTVSACAGLNPLAQHGLAVKVPAQFVTGPVTATQTDKPWEKFSPTRGGFSVLMPGKPTGSDQEVPAEIGKLITHKYTVGTSSGVYVVAYAEFPTAVTDPAVIKAMLDNGRVMMLSATRGDLRSEKEIKLADHLGREWLVSIPGGGIVRARAYWVTQRLYQTVVVMAEGKSPEAETSREAAMSKFLDSFALTGAEAPR